METTYVKNYESQLNQFNHPYQTTYITQSHNNQQLYGYDNFYTGSSNIASVNQNNNQNNNYIINNNFNNNFNIIQVVNYLIVLRVHLNK